MKDQLSPNLSLKEVIKSATAIKHGIDNTPSPEHFENLVAIANKVFQPAREHFGVPIAVTSGYRSPDLNKRIGGSATSQHCHGQALDLDADVYGKITNAQIFNYIKANLDYDQLIWEFGDDNNPNWVHVSYKKDGGNRKKTMRAVKRNGKTSYDLI
jgi:zinc D-Ala-D-Ala carboxypeptidase